MYPATLQFHEVAIIIILFFKIEEETNLRLGEVQVPPASKQTTNLTMNPTQPCTLNKYVITKCPMSPKLGLLTAP